MPSPSFALSAGSLILSLLATPVLSASSRYQLAETWQGKNFLDYFNFYVGSDPTHGYVTYLDKQVAQSKGLVKVTDSGSFYLGVDHKTTLNPSGPGRDSVRIGTKRYYDHSLIVADIAHMPGSICGTWPAFWSVGRKWPTDGEIDIIEGVNLQQYNEIVMHTGGTCSIQDKGMTGTVNATGCGEALGTVGCVVDGTTGSYGTSFNQKGGGVYAMQWTKKFVKIWFFARHSIPSSITREKPDPSQFGLPMALLEDGCDVATSFKAQSFVFDVTFCGDWAGSVYAQSGCPMSSSDGLQSCINHVAQNPSDFRQSYWEINSVKIYQTNVKAPVSSSETPESTSSATSSAIPGSSAIETHTSTAASESPTTTHSATPVSTTENAPAVAAGKSTATSAETSSAPSATTKSSSTTTGCANCVHDERPTTEGLVTEHSATDHSTSERPATLYVTSFVTSTETTCSETQNTATAVTAKPNQTHLGVSTHAGAVDDQTVQSAASATSATHATKPAGTLAGQQDGAPNSTLTISEVTGAKPTEGVSGDTAGPEASADATSSDATNTHDVPSVPTHLVSPNTVPSEASKPAPQNLPHGSSGLAGFLPSSLPSRVSRPLIPAHTSQSSSASIAHQSPASPSDVSPFFTGAANRVSAGISRIAVAFFALILLA